MKGVNYGPSQEECYLNPYVPYFYEYNWKITGDKVLKNWKKIKKWVLTKYVYIRGFYFVQDRSEGINLWKQILAMVGCSCLVLCYQQPTWRHHWLWLSRLGSVKVCVRCHSYTTYCGRSEWAEARTQKVLKQDFSTFSFTRRRNPEEKLYF